jgi:putative transcriptional regulator|tara:strand:+ start:1461 stop:1667 length:207 start_codon:yes stop_codon:yes gene_type:complete
MKNNIKVERARNDMTQAKLAELAEVSRQTINAMELSKYVPSTVLALKLAKIFGREVQDLFELEKIDWR